MLYIIDKNIPRIVDQLLNKIRFLVHYHFSILVFENDNNVSIGGNWCNRKTCRTAIVEERINSSSCREIQKQDAGTLGRCDSGKVNGNRRNRTGHVKRIIR